MRLWFDKYAASVACILILSLTNIDVMFVLFSGAFGEFELCMMPISKLSKNEVHVFGIPQHFLEDIPQFVLQLVNKNNIIRTRVETISCIIFAPDDVLMFVVNVFMKYQDVPNGM